MDAQGKTARALALAAILASAATLAVSLALPTVTFQKLASAEETYSIFGGIESLWEDGNWILAAIVFLFSVVFPIAKLIALQLVWLGRWSRAARLELVEWLELLGKWSMLDVFIVGTFVGAIRLGLLADASSRPGILVFGAAILMSILTTHFIGRIESQGRPRPLCERPALRAWWARLTTLLAATALAAALALPLLQVKKGFLFRNDVALLSTSWKMAGDEEPLLAAALFALVTGTSIARALLLAALRWLPRAPERARRLALQLDEWAMLDVFGLGLVIVAVKLDELATTTLRAGFWAVLAAACLAQLDAWAFRRAVVARRAGSDSASR